MSSLYIRFNRTKTELPHASRGSYAIFLSPSFSRERVGFPTRLLDLTHSDFNKDCGDDGMGLMGKKNKDCYETTYDEDGNSQRNQRDYHEIDENGLKDQGFNDFEIDQLKDTLKACKDKGGYSETICEDRWSIKPPVK